MCRPIIKYDGNNIGKISLMKNSFSTILIVISSFLVSFTIGCNVNDHQNVEPGQTRYFLIGEKRQSIGDSYILPLTTEKDISAALELLKQDLSVRKKIVVAKIEKGGITDEYANKDLFDVTKRVWSWRVTEFLGFADNTVEILDGWPGYVESNLDKWMSNTNGKIGFWNYTVLREVQIGELH